MPDVLFNRALPTRTNVSLRPIGKEVDGKSAGLVGKCSVLLRPEVIKRGPGRKDTKLFIMAYS